MLEKLKKQVLQANLDLVKYGLVLFTFGNVSGIDREKQLIVIKPSGVEYENMTEDDMAVVDFDGKVVEGKYRPSSDTATHIEMYKADHNIGGVVHTHSTFATAFAQANREIIAYGTTHSDYFHGNVPLTRKLTKEEIASEYERNTGIAVSEAMKSDVPAVLVRNHGPFVWGKDAGEAVYHSVILEELAKMNYITETLNPSVSPIGSTLLDKHYNRKHGKNAYYGQVK